MKTTSGPHSAHLPGQILHVMAMPLETFAAEGSFTVCKRFARCARFKREAATHIGAVPFATEKGAGGALCKFQSPEPREVLRRAHCLRDCGPPSGTGGGRGVSPATMRPSPIQQGKRHRHRGNQGLLFPPGRR